VKGGLAACIYLYLTTDTQIPTTMDLIFFYQALAKRKWLVLLLTILAAAIGFSYAFLKKKSYLSSAQYSTGLTMQSKALQEDFNVFEIDVKFNNVLKPLNRPM